GARGEMRERGGMRPGVMAPWSAKPENTRPEARRTRRAVAAGEQAAADDRGDDVDELVADALAGLDGVELEQGVHAGEPGHQANGHEQADLHPGHRHADGPGADRGSADREDPVADVGAEQDPGRDDHEDD